MSRIINIRVNNEISSKNESSKDNSKNSGNRQGLKTHNLLRKVVLRGQECNSHAMLI